MLNGRDYTWLAKHFVRDFGIDPSAMVRSRPQHTHTRGHMAVLVLVIERRIQMLPRSTRLGLIDYGHALFFFSPSGPDNDPMILRSSHNASH